jgi:hypothetical protein
MNYSNEERPDRDVNHFEYQTILRCFWTRTAATTANDTLERITFGHTACFAFAGRGTERGTETDVVDRHDKLILYDAGSSNSTSRPGFTLRALMLPLCNSIARRAIESPSPMPPLVRLRSVSTR